MRYPQDEPIMLHGIASHEFGISDPVHIAHFAAAVLRRMRHGISLGFASDSVVVLSADSLYKCGNARQSQRIACIESFTLN